MCPTGTEPSRTYPSCTMTGVSPTGFSAHKQVCTAALPPLVLRIDTGQVVGSDVGDAWYVYHVKTII